MSKNILVADTPDADRRIAAILPGYDLVFVRTLDQAQQALARAQFALVLIGVHFDESRMFDLLSYMRIAMPRLPVVCCAMMQTQLSEAAMHDLTVAARELGAVDFIDMRQLASADYRTRNEFAERIISRLAAPPASRRSA
jgi:DNA-binding NtrC family response regulator